MAVEERRRKVAALWLQYVPQREIARQCGVSKTQIVKDIEVIRAEFRRDVAEIKEREVTSLDAMENEAIRRYQQDKDREWFSERIRVKTRRAALLGLDAPPRAPTDETGKPVIPSIEQVIIHLAKPAEEGGDPPGS